MSSKSWGYAAGLLPDQDRTFTTGEPYRCPGKCKAPVTHWTSYHYVTGRAGRISRARKKVCTDHAQRFADKHGIEISDMPPPLNGLDIALRGGEPRG